MSEMDIRPNDINDDVFDLAEIVDLDIEVPEADAVEQRQAVKGAGTPQGRVSSWEVDPADAAEQDRVVDLDEDDYR